MHYRFTDDGLSLVRDGEAVLTISQDGELGLLVDNDSRHAGSCSSVLRHGELSMVMRDYQVRWAAMQRTASPSLGNEANRLAGRLLSALGDPSSVQDVVRDALEDLEVVRLAVSKLGEETLEEINACLHTSGRVDRLKKHLETFVGGDGPAPGRP